jgi:type I restriction enzyme S subunit
MSEEAINTADLPASWVLTTLGTVVQYGRTEKAEPHEIADDDWVLELEDIEKDSSRLLQKMTFLERQSKSTKNRFQAGDVLYGKLRPYLNKVLTADEPGYCTTEILPLKSGAHLDNRYLFYWLKHPAFLKYVEAESHGMNMPRLGTEAGKAAPFVLAPRNEQTRIANQLDTLLTHIQSCKDRFDAIPALLKRFRQAVLDAATTGELTEDWRLSNLGEVVPENVVAARLAVAGPRLTKAATEFFTNHQPAKLLNGELPDSWLLTHVGMVGVVSNGSTPSRQEPSYWGGEIPWVSSGEVANGVIRRTREQITEQGFNNSSVRLLPKGTVLMAMIGEGKTRGQSAMLDIDACINQNIAGVVPVAGVLDSKYLWFWFRREYENTRTKGNGSGPKALNCERVRELEINLPPLPEQTEIVRRVEALFAFADRLEARATAARTQAQRLNSLVLSKAFRGELVQQDPQDEPASALLERIASQRTAPTAKKQSKTPRQVRASRAPNEAAAVTKSRQDEDVKGKPYLADHLRRLGSPATAEALFRASELPIADFYKQLAWEVAQGHIADGGTTLEARNAAG